MTSRSFLPVVEYDNPPPRRKAIYSVSIFQQFQQCPGRFDGGGGILARDQVIRRSAPKLPKPAIGCNAKPVTLIMSELWATS
jgi:hypothetical protein